MIARIKAAFLNFVRRHICDDDPADVAERRRLAAMAENEYACGEP